MIIGYTTGVFDLFHVGHVRILQNARSLCDHLIVGVSTDELCREYKKKIPVIPFNERLDVVRSVRWVDVAVAQETRDKVDAHNRYKFDIMFVGDDWYRSGKWQGLEEQFSDLGVRIVYFPYTNTTSSTVINATLERLRLDAEE
ncbi:MAG: glycerol-3-phosphate cytidylyltransferase [Myxococcota bacterium]|jgi:glycerol-3-phosphate cytidylyltransferase